MRALYCGQADLLHILPTDGDGGSDGALCGEILPATAPAFMDDFPTSREGVVCASCENVLMKRMLGSLLVRVGKLESEMQGVGMSLAYRGIVV